MPRALEVIAGFATNPGATLTTLTFSTGLSSVIRGTDASKGTWLLNAWGFCATAGELRITSPRLHDQVQGIRNRVTAAYTAPLICGYYNGGYAQRLYAQDNLTVQVSGGGAEIDTGALLIGYDDLQGVAGRFIDYPTLKKNGINIVTVEVTVTAVATGNFGGAVAINSTNDNLIANTDYAIIGGMVDTRGNVARVLGVDLGNLGCGFPAEPTMREQTNTWFQALSIAYNAPYIPVINSANKTATTVDIQTNQAGGTYIVNLQLVQLAAGAVSTTTATAPGTQPGS